MYKIAVAQFYDAYLKNYGDITSTINANFCAARGYSYFLRRKPVLHGYHPAWERLPLLLDLLHTNAFDYVMWLDADAIFNGTRSIEEFIEKATGKNLILSTDVHKHCSFPGAERVDLNTGVMIFRDSSWSREFIKALLFDGRCEQWHQCSRGKKIADGSECWWEQNCMEKFFVDNVMECIDNACIINCEDFNTYLNRTALVYHMQKFNNAQRLPASFVELEKARVMYLDSGYEFTLNPDKREPPTQWLAYPKASKSLMTGYGTRLTAALRRKFMNIASYFVEKMVILRKAAR